MMGSPDLYAVPCTSLDYLNHGVLSAVLLLSITLYYSLLLSIIILHINQSVIA